MIYLLSPDPLPTFPPQVTHLPALEVEFLSPPLPPLEEVDYLLFTSKQGVRGIDKLTSDWKKVPAVVVGKATGREVKKLGGKVALAGNGYGEELISQISAQIPDKSQLLFLRGARLSTPVGEILRQRGYRVIEKVVYRTRCKKLPPKLEGIPIFTSPFTADCFFRQVQWEGDKAVAIGRKTARQVEKYWKGELYLPPIPSIGKAVELALELEKKGEEKRGRGEW
jgi:uroporphyrinogen-III synthase